MVVALSLNWLRDNPIGMPKDSLRCADRGLIRPLSHAHLFLLYLALIVLTRLIKCGSLPGNGLKAIWVYCELVPKLGASRASHQRE